MRNAWVIGLCLLACKQENDFIERTGSDTWRQAANDRVDILFVVDDSGTMEDEQATLAAGFTSFAEQLDDSQTNFHLGVLTTTFDYTDPDRGRLVGVPLYLTNDDPDYVEQFSARAQVGTVGSDQERGLAAANYALSPAVNLDLNEGFMRRDARLLVVFVSDEEDCSDGGALMGGEGEDCYDQRELLTPTSEFVEDFRGLKDSLADLQVMAIIGVPGAACQNVYPSTRYRDVAQLTGGLVADICQGDWSAMLTNLGLNATGVIERFQLSNGAKPDSLEVFVDEEPVPRSDQNGWSYDDATWYITFHGDAIPPRGSEIVANYTVQPGQPRPPGADEDPLPPE